MTTSPRCLYNSSFAQFNTADPSAVLGILCDKYFGNTVPGTMEAWTSEIAIMKRVLAPYSNTDGKIIFEYGDMRSRRKFE